MFILEQVMTHISVFFSSLTRIHIEIWEDNIVIVDELLVIPDFFDGDTTSIGSH